MDQLYNTNSMIMEFLRIKKRHEVAISPKDESKSPPIDAPFSREELEKLVQQIIPMVTKLHEGEELQFVSDATCIFEVNSGESYGFKIISGEKKYFLKIGKPGLKQSYQQEHEQEQAINYYFNRRMSQLRLTFPRYVFVAEAWCLTEFVEGKPLDTLPPSITNFIDELEAYMSKQKHGFFDTVAIDLMPTNFLRRNDGSLCWLDPFYLK